MSTVRPTPDFTSAGRVRYTLTPALLSAKLTDWQALTGTFQLQDSDSLFDSSDNAEKVGPFLSGTLRPIGRNACQVTQIYRGAVVTQAWEFADEDATVMVSILNKSLRTIKYPTFGDLVAQWPSPPTGVAAWFEEAYVRDVRRAILTPSYFVRLRACYLVAGGVGLSVYPINIGDDKDFFWWLAADGGGDTKRGLRCIWDRAILPGQSQTFRLGIRVSDVTTVEHLLAPYKGAK